MKSGITLASVAVTGIGYYKSRAVVYNFLKKKDYLKPAETALVNEAYHHPIDLEFTEIESIMTFRKGKPLSQLPDGLNFQQGALTGTPKESCIGQFTIRVYKFGGYIHEEFDLTIKKNGNDPDDQEPQSDSWHFPGSFFKKKGNSSQMIPLLPV